MKKPSAGFPHRCRSCRRGWSLLRIAMSGAKDILRCACCGYQNTLDEAEEAARDVARARP